MTSTQAKALGAGKDDAALLELGRKFGLFALACDWDGLDPLKEYKTTDFSKDNVFANLAWMQGHIERVIKEVHPKAGDPFIRGEDGEPLPAIHTVWKDS